ncbi:MAG: SulP family inorganic anion transporter, partial [Gaiellales bacterium]
GSWQLGSIVLGALTTVLVLVGPRIHRLFPAVLAAVIVGLIVSGLGAQVGAEIGPIDAGFLPIGLDVPWSDLASLLVGGAVIALVGFAEPAAIARTFATLERHRWSADREFVSQGAANVASAISGGFPVGGSFSRSALNRQAGARTRWSGGMTGLVVLIFLPFAGILEPLPTAVLAGIVIGAVVPLVRLRPLVLIWRYSKAQFAVAWATLGLTLALAPNVQWAVVAGVAIAIAVHLARELSLDVETGADGESVILRPVGVLWFGTAHILEDRLVRLLAEHRTARRLVVRLGGVGRLDLSGALALRRLVGHARASGLEVVLDDVPPRARRWVAPLIEDEREPL